MRTVLDFSPLHRSSIGFERIFDLLEAAQSQPSDNWPPFDTMKLAEDRYRITMAVAGFKRDEIDICVQENLLVIKGERKNDVEGEYLHRGIAYRPFVRRFELAQHVQVTDAHLADGLLNISLKRELPEAMKPRRVQIDTDEAVPAKVRQIEQHAAA
ncbi:Hsp20 family protein [Dyella sp.]|uniref:Hsp20 family protein n=1 Tax=Dyella sp. TaxID=1869338 RepID=UPI002B46C9CC|nr:Hsp20 family protein [Dyella sp.]HKT26871.1 Hsp20 family protein [Dyella sp.]